MKNLRIQPVAVAMILNETRDKFLLVNNRRWNEYALPMQKVGEKTPSEAALGAVTDRNFPGNVEGPTAAPITYLHKTFFSAADRVWKAYEYHVFEIALANPLEAPLHPDLRWFSYEELREATNVTKSTKWIAEEVVEQRQIAVAIVTRERAGTKELMLIDNPKYGLFPPASRIKDLSGAGYWARQALRDDVLFDGTAEPVRTVTVGQQEHTDSQRYRFDTWRSYVLCWFAIDPDEIKVDLTWHPIDDLQSLKRASPHLDEIRLHLQQP